MFKKLILVSLLTVTSVKSMDFSPSQELVDEVTRNYLDISITNSNSIISSTDSIWLNKNLNDMKYHFLNFNASKERKRYALIIGSVFVIPYLIYVYRLIASASKNATDEYDKLEVVMEAKKKAEEAAREEEKEQEGQHKTGNIPNKRMYVNYKIMLCIRDAILDFLSNPFSMEQSWKVIACAHLANKYYSYNISYSSNKFKTIYYTFNHILPLYKTKSDLLNGKITGLSQEQLFSRMESINKNIQAAMDAYRNDIVIKNLVKQMFQYLNNLAF